MTTARLPVLFIVDGSVAVTGALVSAARQANLMASEVQTILVLPRGHQVPPERTITFAEVIDLPIVNLRKSIASVLLYLPSLLIASIQLRLAMRRRGCDRLQLNDFYFLHGALLRLLGFRGRIVTFVRINTTPFGVAGRLWLAAARWCSTETVAVSRFIQRLLGPDHPSRLIYDHISTEDRAIQPQTTQSPLLLFVGNYIEGKGQDEAIAAFHRIAVRFPAARLRFVGGDMGLDKNRLYRARLVQRAAAGPAPDRIEFRGHCDDLRADYAEAFAALNFSESESFSNTCLDASASSLAVVATRCGGPEEIIDDGVTGFLVPVGDVSAMADRIAWLLENPKRAGAMGAAGRKLVAERFASERARIQLSDLFDLWRPRRG